MQGILVARPAVCPEPWQEAAVQELAGYLRRISAKAGQIKNLACIAKQSFIIAGYVRSQNIHWDRLRTKLGSPSTMQIARQTYSPGTVTQATAIAYSQCNRMGVRQSR